MPCHATGSGWVEAHADFFEENLMCISGKDCGHDVTQSAADRKKLRYKLCRNVLKTTNIVR